MKRIVEIVCCSLKDCIDASRSGAGRIELCAAIELGGLTPSTGLLELTKQSVPVPVMAMIRPRAGGYCYSELEIDTMVRDCALMKSADGFVFGCVTPEFDVDIPRCKELVTAAGNKDKVFHRAFDRLADPLASLETIIDLGFTRILTSGHAPNASDGAETIEKLIEAAKDRIEIMPGGGVRSTNIREILATGCTSVHLAPVRETQDPTSGVSYRSVDRQEVEAVVKLVG